MDVFQLLRHHMKAKQREWAFKQIHGQFIVYMPMSVLLMLRLHFLVFVLV